MIKFRIIGGTILEPRVLTIACKLWFLTTVCFMVFTLDPDYSNLFTMSHFELFLNFWRWLNVRVLPRGWYPNLSLSYFRAPYNFNPDGGIDPARYRIFTWSSKILVVDFIFLFLGLQSELQRVRRLTVEIIFNEHPCSWNWNGGFEN